MSYGAQVKFGIARQASAGTAATDPGSYHPLAFLSEDIGLEKQEVISQNNTGRFEEGAVYDGPANVAGTLAVEMTPRSIAAALAATVNHSPASTTSASIRTLEFLPNTVDFSSTLCKAPWSIYKQWTDANSAEQFYDCQFTGLEFRLQQGAFTQLTATVAGGTRSTNGIGSLSIIPDGNDIRKLFPWNVASISYGGSAVSDMSDVTVSLQENISPLYSINGTLTPYKFTRTGFRQVVVSGNFYLSNRTMLNNFVSGTQARLIVTLINTLSAIQSGYYDTLTIDVPQLKITAFKPATSGPGEVSVPFTGRGVNDPSSYYSIKFTQVTTYQAGF